MRRIYLTGAMVVLAAVITLLLALRVSATTWGDAFVIADPAGNLDVAIDSSGGMHFVWWNSKRLRIQYRHCTAADTCDAVEQLPVLDGDAFAPALALDPQDRPNVVWEQRKGDKSSIYYSRRDSSEWNKPDRVSGQLQSHLPDIAIGKDGVKHIVYETIDENGRGIYHDTRGGSSNTLQLVALESAEADDRVANGRNVRVAIDNNERAHIVWSTPSPPRIKYSYQNANGTFETPVLVADQDQAQGPDLAIDRKTNRVGIIWETRRDELASFALYKNGERLFRQANVSGDSDPLRKPRLAADCGGRFHIVFQSQQLIQTDWNIYHRVFTPGNNTFTPAERVTDSDTDDVTPVIATSDFIALGYGVADNDSVQAVRGETGSGCDDDPTPVPTPLPTAPADGWEHIPNEDARIVYTKGWTAQNSNQASEDNYARCQKDGNCKKNASAELVFTGGTRVEWETAYAANFGKADVYIDGKAFEIVDLCTLNRNSEKPKFGTRTYILSGNENTQHRIKIVAVGHTGCSDVNKNFVAVDGFNILR